MKKDIYSCVECDARAVIVQFGVLYNFGYCEKHAWENLGIKLIS